MEQYTKDLRDYFKARKKPLTVFLIVLFAMCIIGMVLASFFDLDIMQALNNPNQGFSSFMQDYGEFPSYIINVGFLVAASVWFVRIKKYWLGIFPLVSAMVFGYIYVISYFENSSAPILFNVLFNVLFITGVGVGLFFTPRKVFDKILFLMLVIFIVAAAAYFVMYVVKLLWGRIRFRDLSADLSDFTPWYKPNGINGNKSFFSGHVSTACCLTILWFVPAIFKLKNRFVIGLLFVFPVLYTIAMMYARITVGAHYPSDTIFAIIHFTIWMTVITHVLCRKPKQVLAEKKSN